uniref:Uncharacterized protein n=1 Tax=Sphaerodactylus townsendi TaxID=933632 RepID=A0ACB8F593_9SAUR
MYFCEPPWLGRTIKFEGTNVPMQHRLVALHPKEKQGINSLYSIFHRSNDIHSGDSEPGPSDIPVLFLWKCNPVEDLSWDFRNMVFREVDEPCQSNFSHRRSMKGRQTMACMGNGRNNFV